MSPPLLTIVLLLLIGFAIRVGVRPVWRLHLPASVVAGVVGLLMMQRLRLRADPMPVWAAEVIAAFRSWPGPLVALIFAGLLIERPNREGLGSSRDVVRQAIAAWIVVLGQVLLGMVVTWVWARRVYGVPGTFGQLIEVGMAGGPGTARAMGDVYARQFGFPAGTDLGLFVATFGLVWGLISGIALARLGVRRGWTRTGPLWKVPPS